MKALMILEYLPITTTVRPLLETTLKLTVIKTLQNHRSYNQAKRKSKKQENMKKTAKTENVLERVLLLLITNLIYILLLLLLPCLWAQSLELSSQLKLSFS